MQSFSKKVFNILSKEKTNMLTQLYRKYIPQNIREKVYIFILKDLLFFYRNFTVLVRAKSTYLFFFLYKKTPTNQMYQFMGKYGLTPYPWPFTLEYNTLAECLKDEPTGLYYVFHNNKKLFFPKEFTVTQIQLLYKSLLIEQDMRSPHKYLEGNFLPLQGKILLDIGGAEGIFSLDAVEYIQHAYIFECEPIWTDALTQTFAPWINKVSIIPKYVSNKNSDTEITVDHFLKTQSFTTTAELFIKMDIEGAELFALQGASETLKNNNVQLSVCTYHTPTDAESIDTYLRSLGYCTQFTEGYLFFNKSFNRGILRSFKTNKH